MKPAPPAVKPNLSAAAAFKRAANILKAEEKKGALPTGAPSAVSQPPEEAALYAALVSRSARAIRDRLRQADASITGQGRLLGFSAAGAGVGVGVEPGRHVRLAVHQRREGQEGLAIKKFLKKYGACFCYIHSVTSRSI